MKVRIELTIQPTAATQAVNAEQMTCVDCCTAGTDSTWNWREMATQQKGPKVRIEYIAAGLRD